MDIKDPCSNEPGFDSLVGTYIGFLQYGVNYTNKKRLRAATLAGYTKDVNTLFTLRGFTSPVNFYDPDNAANMKIMNHQNKKDIAVQRYPLNSAILAKVDTMASSSSLMDSGQNLMFYMT